MGKNILIVAIVAVAAYLVGVESAKARGKNYEDLRHQLERLWNEPGAKRSRKRMAKKAHASIERTMRQVQKLGD